MKTATVRELRNNFARLAKWIEHGEQITITKNGQRFAKLSPATTDKPRKVDWAARSRKAKTARAQDYQPRTTEELWSRLARLSLWKRTLIPIPQFLVFAASC